MDRVVDGRELDPKAHPDDAGAYIGHEAERVAETIPGVIDPHKDERLSATDARSSGEGALDGRLQEAPMEGHRTADRASDDDIREAGQDR